MSYADVTPAVTRRLGLRPPSDAGAVETAVRAFQTETGLPVTGEIDPATEAALAARAIGNPLPLWYGTDEQDRVVTSRLGHGADAVKRFQSGAGMYPTGVVDEETARLLGD